MSDITGPEVRRPHFDVAEYHRMAETGILSEGARVELVGGEVVELGPIGSRHHACDHNEPQPALALLKPREDFYEDRHPGPADALVVVEVSDTTLSYDRNVKLPPVRPVRYPGGLDPGSLQQRS